MIAQKGREGRRAKALKLARLFKEGKCKDCSVVVTRMDFAKILGKFTKVKIQYESSTPKTQKSSTPKTQKSSTPKTQKSSTPKTQKITRPATPKSNGRLRNNENGMIQGLRSRSNETAAKPLHRPKILKSKEANLPKQKKNNILKENNALKKVTTSTSTVMQAAKKSISNKKFGIIFSSPKNNSSNEFKSKSSLIDLLPKVDNIVLPSLEWCIDYYPKLQEPTNDKLYDRIAAELEDLMKTETPQIQSQDNAAVTDNKETDDNNADEFPSIMDILNDNTNVTSTEQKDQSSIEFKGNLDPSTTLDVEAMLLGKTEDPIKSLPMDVDSSEVESDKKLSENNNSYDDNPGSPSILNESSADEPLPSLFKSNDDKSIEEVANTDSLNDKAKGDSNSTNEDRKEPTSDAQDIPGKNSFNLPLSKLDKILYLTFKKIVDGKCLKSVKCPKNLKFNIELDQKSVELIGAPKFISTLDDLQVLLQIVNESEPTSSYIQCL